MFVESLAGGVIVVLRGWRLMCDAYDCHGNVAIAVRSERKLYPPRPRLELRLGCVTTEWSAQQSAFNDVVGKLVFSEHAMDAAAQRVQRSAHMSMIIRRMPRFY